MYSWLLPQPDRTNFPWEDECISATESPLSVGQQLSQRQTSHCTELFIQVRVRGTTPPSLACSKPFLLPSSGPSGKQAWAQTNGSLAMSNPAFEGIQSPNESLSPRHCQPLETGSDSRKNYQKENSLNSKNGTVWTVITKEGLTCRTASAADSGKDEQCQASTVEGNHICRTGQD